MFVSGIVQYNSTNESLGSNLRLRWEYAPGSELFVVYTDDYNTDPVLGMTSLRNRAFVVKINTALSVHRAQGIGRRAQGRDLRTETSVTKQTGYMGNTACRSSFSRIRRRFACGNVGISRLCEIQALWKSFVIYGCVFRQRLTVVFPQSIRRPCHVGVKRRVCRSMRRVDVHETHRPIDAWRFSESTIRGASLIKTR